MKPAPLDHVRATGAGHAVALLAEHGDTARVLAGGQSLVPLLATRRVRPTLLVDVDRCDELAYLRDDGGHVEIGATTRARDVERSALVPALLPAALRHCGHVTIRNRGTVGGSVAFADPAAELPAALVTLDADVVLTGPAGPRTLPVAEFLRGPHRTAAAPDELLTAVRVRRPAPGTVVAVLELARGGTAIVSVLAALHVGDDGRIAEARIGIGGAAPVPVRAHAAERLLTGAPPVDEPGPDDELLRAAGDAAVAATDPADDVLAPAAYRRRITAVLVRRALAQALQERTPAA